MKRWDSNRRTMLAIAVLLCAACASEPTSGPGAPSPTLPGGRAPAPSAPAAEPAGPPAPVPEPTRDAKAQSQRTAMEAVDQLQNGDESAARATLDRALTMDPANELAKRLMDQIRADAQRELGSTFFRYTVQPDDSLSKLAQRFLGDRFRFYILAKYNDITNPGRLHTGQVIKIPGKEPPPVAAPARPPEVAKPVEPPEVAKPPAEPVISEAERLYKQALAQKQSGDLDAAYTSLRDANRREPANATYSKQLETTRIDLVKRYDRAATQAFQRQNLDLAIKNWDRVIDLDPNNQKAKLERGRAEDLKKRMQEKFGNK